MYVCTQCQKHGSILGGYAQEGALFIDRTAQESRASHDWGLWLFVDSSFQRS
jgi:hypothetical protein